MVGLHSREPAREVEPQDDGSGPKEGYHGHSPGRHLVLPQWVAVLQWREGSIMESTVWGRLGLVRSDNVTPHQSKL